MLDVPMAHQNTAVPASEMSRASEAYGRGEQQRAVRVCRVQCHRGKLPDDQPENDRPETHVLLSFLAHCIISPFLRNTAAGQRPPPQRIYAK